jgi:hypothetical protein
MKTVIHVNQHAVRRKDDKTITVKTYKSNRYAREVEILGPSRVVYSPDKPLSCGARVWIETHAEVVVDGEKQ